MNQLVPPLQLTYKTPLPPRLPTVPVPAPSIKTTVSEARPLSRSSLLIHHSLAHGKISDSLNVDLSCGVDRNILLFAFTKDLRMKFVPKHSMFYDKNRHEKHIFIKHDKNI